MARPEGRSLDRIALPMGPVAGSGSLSLQLRLAILDGRSHEFDQFPDNCIRELVVRQALAQSREID